MIEVLKKLQLLAEELPDGFTVYLPDLTPVKRGWVVGQKETQNSFGTSGLLKAYEVAINTSQLIGGWKDGELFYWDAVLLFNNEDEATKAGIENGQLAIYQLETGRLKWLD